jgi:hypothetical protein
MPPAGQPLNQVIREYIVQISHVRIERVMCPPTFDRATNVQAVVYDSKYSLEDGSVNSRATGCTDSQLEGTIRMFEDGGNDGGEGTFARSGVVDCIW